MDNSHLSTSNYPHRGQSRSSSRSPSRASFIDPFLVDLSPATALKIFTGASDQLKASIKDASPSQRAFGIQAAVASKKVQEWYEELSNWDWTHGPQGFEIPSEDIRASKRRKLSSEHVIATEAEEADDFEMEEYWGCLPASLVKEYEARVEDIRKNLEDLEIEELKEKVLGKCSRNKWNLFCSL